MIAYDLHIHTTASDGVFSPSEVVEKAVQRHLMGIAITDHDASEGVEEGIRYAAEKYPDFQVIPGIEINTNEEKESIHVLGYGMDFRAAGWKYRLQEMRSWREERAQSMIERLQRLGYRIRYEEVEALAKSSIGRPHIARALVMNRAVPTEKWAFDHLLTRGKPAYVPRHPFTPWDAAQLIHQFGGLCVLAHPGLIKNQKMVQELLDRIPGTFDGIEVHYPAHQLYQVKKYTEYARQRDLFLTGGSDFHGSISNEHAPYIGFRGIDKENFQIFRQKLAKQ